MARPREFDRDEALNAAIGVFWRQGYEATSMDDLLRAMKISRQSLYDTFGDKHRLYLEALARYNDESVGSILACLDSDSSPLAGLRKMLLVFSDLSEEQRPLGCMGINAIAEFGQSEPDVLAVGEVSGRRLETALRGIISQAKAKGEISAATDETAAAQFIGASLAGLKISAKAGLDRAALRNIVEMTVRGLGPL
jgi:AcrR family transcriptional regulator